MKTPIILILIIFNFNLNINGQTRTIQGRVISEDLEEIPQVCIQVKDTILVGKTDLEGRFKINIPLETNKLLFSFFCMEPALITLQKDCDTIEVILMKDGTYDFWSSRKIDKDRLKRFKKIPELHMQAYNKGLFKKKSVCFTREFIPDKPALDIIRKEQKEFRKINKNDFKQLNIGDIVKIPFGIDTTKNENIVRTYYSPCRNCTEEDYDYLIEGVVMNKHRRKLTLKIKITNMFPYDFLKYRESILNVGSVFKYKMEYFEVIIDKNSKQHKNK